MRKRSHFFVNLHIQNVLIHTYPAHFLMAFILYLPLFKKNNMGFIKEFKDFAMKGNLIDIAVGLVMATAFGKVVSAFVDGMFMPLVGKLFGNVDFSKMEYTLQKGTEAVKEVKDSNGTIVTQAADAVAAVTIKYGAFITTIIDFVLVAFVMFVIIKAMNASKKKEEEAPAAAAISNEEKLLTEIRDLLKK